MYPAHLWWKSVNTLQIFNGSISFLFSILFHLQGKGIFPRACYSSVLLAVKRHDTILLYKALYWYNWTKLIFFSSVKPCCRYVWKEVRYFLEILKHAQIWLSGLWPIKLSQCQVSSVLLWLPLAQGRLCYTSAQWLWERELNPLGLVWDCAKAWLVASCARGLRVTLSAVASKLAESCWLLHRCQVLH